MKKYNYSDLLSVIAEEWRRLNYIIKINLKEEFINQEKIYQIHIQDFENFGFYNKTSYDKDFIDNYDNYIKKEIIAAFAERHRIKKITKSSEDFNKFILKKFKKY